MGTTNSSQRKGGAPADGAQTAKKPTDATARSATAKAAGGEKGTADIADISVDTTTPLRDFSKATGFEDTFRFDGPSMNRAMTFDDRYLAAAQQRSLPEGIGRKRTASLLGDHRGGAALEPPPCAQYDDVLFRRFFGEGPNLQKAQSLVGLVPDAYGEAQPVAAERSEAVVVVDTFSTGAMLAYNLYHQGYKVICVLSGESVEKLLEIVPEGMDTQFVSTITFDQNIDPGVALAKLSREVNSCGIPIAAVMAGAETGVELADALSEYLNLRTNGTALSEARRNKFVMGETVRAAGIRAVKQLYATKWNEIAAFLEEWQPDPFKVIVKPIDSAGSEDVTLCLSIEDCQKAFGNIIGKINGLGIMNKAVLVQEYLEGTEYIIDIVSRDGEHKVIGIWEYDRRLANGSPTVCFGYKLLTGDAPRCREMMDYMRKVIDALGIRHGPTHGEVKWFKGEPVLVEVGARCQGGEGLFVKVADEAIGYNQVDATIAAYLRADDYAALPVDPMKRIKYGFMKWLCSFKEGQFKGYNAENVAEIEAMASYRGHQWFVKPGSYMNKTRNCFSWVGLVRLVNSDEAALQRDWDRLEEMQSSTLFEIDDKPVALVNPNASKCVAVVDPFTTGAVLAYNATLRGYKLIAVYSQELAKLDKLTSMVPKGLPLVFDAVVAFQSIPAMATAISGFGWEVVAVMAGAETGVELADSLSEHMGLRTNGTAFSEARRNKYMMGEAVRNAGLRAVKQLYTTKWSEIADFLEEWKPDPFKVIVKPVDSAGSEDVTLCLSVEACYAAFNNIFGKINGLGLRNKAVLVQEYLEGTEYIIDCVSRDGEHKVVAIWEYDRRIANGSPTVCFGWRVVQSDAPRCREMMDYMRKVIDALGIRHGPTHGEVKWFKGEPVLVEVGARCQGGEGFFVQIADETLGHNQVDDTLTCYLSPELFSAIPAEPSVLKKQGWLKALCSFKEGLLRCYDDSNVAEIVAMESYRGHELFVQPGSFMNKTRNLFTLVGLLRLVNEDSAALQRDWDRVEEMQNTTLLDIEEDLVSRSRTRSNAQDEQVFQDKASAQAYSDFEKTTLSLLTPIQEEGGKKSSPQKGYPAHQMVPLAEEADRRALRVSFHSIDSSADAKSIAFKNRMDNDGFTPLQKKVSFQRADQPRERGDDSFVPLKKKSNTFVEKRLANSIESFVHRKPLKKAVTFVSTSHLRKTVVKANSTLSYDDVMYRRFFGEKPALLKLPTLHGIVPNVYDTPVATQKLSSEVAVVVVDTFSTGANLACDLYHQGYKVICALSGKAVEKLLEMVAEGLDTEFTGTFIYDDDAAPSDALTKLAREVNSCGIPIAAVMAGAETGVELADALSEYLNLRTNGTALTEARRNKFIMGEAVRAAGIRAVKQLYATKWSEIAAFLEEWQPDPFKVIVKPVDSAGSEDVTLCLSIEDCQKAFGNIIGKINGLGLVNLAVLVQEYLEGTEYIIDSVSRDGEHKVIGIWEYDRRLANGAVTTCFGQRLLSAEEPRCREMMDYIRKVIDALGIRHGPTHGEVKWFKGEPVLVEVGARCQGGEGLFLSVAREAMGYNQIDATIAAYLSEEKFNAFPSEPINRKMFGSLKWLCSFKEGPFKEYCAADVAEITKMESYRGHQFFVKPGSTIRKTKNCFTWVGCVRLTHKDEETVKRDLARLEVMETTSLFILSEDAATLAAKNMSKKCVAVVDPFSTGAVVAYNATQLGFKCIAVYSAGLDQLDALTSLVPAGIDLTFDGIVAFTNKENMATAISGFGWEVVAVMAGAETGVELADAISEHMGLRTNGTALSEARRNKFVMGETVRAAGIRAVKQLYATKWNEIAAFLEEWQPDPFKVIVKPIDSAGSEDVTLCFSMDEVKAAFNHIFGKINGLGIVNKAVLVQEYLEGTEYVVDTVSRDGEHKVVAIWEYDRRCVNGASFVCFGQRMLSGDEPRCPELMTYMLSVINALGINNGPSHGEVKWCKGEPVLVEVGARCHGIEGHWVPLADRALGYNQAMATCVSYLDKKGFDELPPKPLKLKTNGRMMFFVSRVSGTLSEINPQYIAEMQSMASFVNFEMFLKVGAQISKTVNCFTFGGIVLLIHDDLDVVLNDGDRIRAMEDSGLFCIANAPASSSK